MLQEQGNFGLLFPEQQSSWCMANQFETDRKSQEEFKMWHRDSKWVMEK